MNADRSCQNIVNEFTVQRVSHGLAACSTHTGSYCKARQRLPLEMVSELVRCTGALIDMEVPTHWRWEGRPVKLIDGTTVTMPDTEDNQATYPQQRGQKPGLGFPISRIVGVICLASGGILNAAMTSYSGKGASEQALLRGMLNLIRIIMAQAASFADILPRQLSFKHALQLWRVWRQQSNLMNEDESLRILCLLIAENRVGNRPGRIEPRMIKRRPKPYSLLVIIRGLARVHVKKYGHPKKQK